MNSLTIMSIILSKLGTFLMRGAAKSRPFQDHIISVQPDNINYLNTNILKCLNPKFKEAVLIFQVAVII